jgi:uracil-DNA glycosylase
MTASTAEALEDVLVQVRACRLCVTDPQGKALPHEPRPVIRGRASARIAVCGQAPGIRVHRSGVPFSDPSGERLRSWMGITGEEFYDEDRVAIVPMGFCFPGYDAKGSDLPPRRECAPLWRERVFAALPDLALLLVIGSHAMRWHLPGIVQRSMTDTVAAWGDISGRTGVFPAVLPLPHPSWRNSGWLKAHPWFEADVLPELRSRVRTLLR